MSAGRKARGGVAFHVSPAVNDNRRSGAPRPEAWSPLPIVMGCVLAGVLLAIHAAARFAP